MSTWIVGDVHGCADELALLIDALALTGNDQLVIVGDLFHRGPDAWGVACLLRAHGALFVLGNHELAVLRRVGLAPTAADGSDRPPLRETFPPVAPDDLAGDGRRPIAAPREHLADILVFLQGHSGFVLTSRALPGAGQTPDGRDWLVVHAGVPPQRDPLTCTPEELVYPARVGGRRSPFWYEQYPGPDLVHFGHLPNREPLMRRVDGRLVALGLDTACVYGGKLTAYCPELDELRSVPAARTYASM